MKKRRFDYMADMGCIKIMVQGGSIFFMNDFGDGIFNVIICKEDDVPENTKFKGHFTIFKEGWLMYSDCNNEQKQYKFSKGRYFVELGKNGTTFYIYKQDEDIHA